MPTKPAKKKPAREPTSRTSPQTGAGRPRKPREATASQSSELERVEKERSDAAATHRAEPTIRSKVKWLEAEMRVASAHAALCRSQGNFTHALEFGSLLAKYAAQHTAAKDQQMADDLLALEQKVKREHAAAAGAR